MKRLYITISFYTEVRPTECSGPVVGGCNNPNEVDTPCACNCNCGNHMHKMCGNDCGADVIVCGFCFRKLCTGVAGRHLMLLVFISLVFNGLGFGYFGYFPGKIRYFFGSA